MKHLILGHGEVGKAIYEILLLPRGPKVDEIQWIDAKLGDSFTDDILGFYIKNVDVLHVCIPYKNSDQFDNAINDAINKWLKKTSLIIIHSSVPVGTSSKWCAVHSPIRGVHPNLVEGIKTFKKYFGCSDLERAKKAATIFAQRGIDIGLVTKSENTEAAKLWDTTQYGWMIILNKLIKRWCDKRGLDFNFIYTSFNESYNEGYRKLGKEHVVRPYLKHMSGEIGGHCVIPNIEFLRDSPVAQIIEMVNEQEK